MRSERSRGRKIVGLAALGALVVWLLRRARPEKPAPEGTWRDLIGGEGAGS